MVGASVPWGGDRLYRPTSGIVAHRSSSHRVHVPETSQDTDQLYVGHLRDALAGTDSQQDRVMTLNVVVSTLLLALAQGIVSASKKFEISGLSFQLPLTSLLLGSAALSACLYVLFLALQRRREALQDALWDRYKDLGVQKPDSDLSDPFVMASLLEAALPLRRLDLGGSTFAQVTNAATSFVVAVAVVLLPPAAQTGAVLAAGAARYWYWFALPAFCLLSLAAWISDG